MLFFCNRVKTLCLIAFFIIQPATSDDTFKLESFRDRLRANGREDFLIIISLGGVTIDLSRDDIQGDQRITTIDGPEVPLNLNIQSFQHLSELFYNYTQLTSEERAQLSTEEQRQRQGGLMLDALSLITAFFTDNRTTMNETNRASRSQESWSFFANTFGVQNPNPAPANNDMATARGDSEHLYRGYFTDNKTSVLAGKSHEDHSTILLMLAFLRPYLRNFGTFKNMDGGMFNYYYGTVQKAFIRQPRLRFLANASPSDDNNKCSTSNSDPDLSQYGSVEKIEEMIINSGQDRAVWFLAYMGALIIADRFSLNHNEPLSPMLTEIVRYIRVTDVLRVFVDNMLYCDIAANNNNINIDPNIRFDLLDECTDQTNKEGWPNINYMTACHLLDFYYRLPRGNTHLIEEMTGTLFNNLLGFVIINRGYDPSDDTPPTPSGYTPPGFIWNYPVAQFARQVISALEQVQEQQGSNSITPAPEAGEEGQEYGATALDTAASPSSYSRSLYGALVAVFLRMFPSRK